MPILHLRAHLAAASAQPFPRGEFCRQIAYLLRRRRPRGASSSGYTQLRRGEHYGVDDPASPHCNRIVRKDAAGASSGEDMGAYPALPARSVPGLSHLPRGQGRLLHLPHVWPTKTAGTARCAGLAEADARPCRTGPSLGKRCSASCRDRPGSGCAPAFPGCDHRAWLRWRAEVSRDRPFGPSAFLLT
jgi:hypothetical protein